MTEVGKAKLNSTILIVTICLIVSILIRAVYESHFAPEHLSGFEYMGLTVIVIPVVSSIISCCIVFITGLYVCKDRPVKCSIERLRNGEGYVINYIYGFSWLPFVFEVSEATYINLPEATQKAIETPLKRGMKKGNKNIEVFVHE